MKKNTILSSTIRRAVFIIALIASLFTADYSQKNFNNKVLSGDFLISKSFQDVALINNVGTSKIFNFDSNASDPSDLREILGFDWNQQNSFSFLALPSISSISPSTPQTSTSDQNITVNGSNFASGLTVTVTFPSGGTGTLSGSQIQNVTSSSFVMKITFNATGTWRIRVNNPNGEQSSQFSFNVVTAQTPSISSVSPSSPTVSNSDQNVQVSGSNFQNGMTVTIFFPGGGSGILSGTQLQNITPTSFRMVATLNIVGTYGIRINNPSGLQSSTFNFQTQAAAPSISSISPSGVCAQSGDRNFTVSGSNFVSGLTVTAFFPGGGSATVSGTQIQNVTSTSFTMTVTLNVIGTYNFRVNNPGGSQSSQFPYTTQNCNPNISSINPSSPTVSNNDQTVSVAGSNFQSGLTVTVFFPGGGSGTLQGSQIQFNSSGSFNMIVTLNIVGQYQIRVNNPNGTTSPNFSFNTQAAAPVINSISPSSSCVRNVDQSVTVNGSNFTNDLTVSVTFPTGGTGTLSGSQIQNVTANSFTMIITLADPGNYAIRVINPGGSQSNSLNFTPQNCLSVSGINPALPTQSNVNQDVTVNGNGFTANLTVIVTLPDNSTITLSGAQILNVTSSSFTMRATLNATGQWKIKVRNPNGDLSNIFSFTVQSPAPPTVTSINPTSPVSSNADQNVTVNGSNFQPGLTVTVTFPNSGTATLSGTQIQNVTANSFTMRITLGEVGTWCIRVNNPNGGQSSVFCFAVQSGVQAPTIFSINPANPIARSTDQDIIVSGSNFQPNLTVTITFPSGGGTTLGGAQIQNITATSFIMRATLNAVGNWTVKVRNPDGGQSSVFGFSVTGGTNPGINSINPATPVMNGADQNVIVNGSNFQNGLRVNVSFPNGGVATLQGTGQIQNVAANSFLMRITLNAAGSWTIRIVNPDNSQSGQFTFNVQASGPPPTGLPSSVLSPVIGPLRVTSTNQAINDGKWEFNQHKTGNHTPTGGISLSNDTFAWDVNLLTPTSGNADAGKVVFAVADGQVVRYVGAQPGGGPGSVLIAHPNALNPVWFSGYLHMTNVRATLNEFVTPTTILGEIGRIGADNEELHFVIYSGQNTRGNLQSFNATISERSIETTNAPTISAIDPPSVNQSGEPWLITISGANFQSNSMIEVQDPNGHNFIVTPETVSGIENESKIVNVTATSITAQIVFGAAGNYEFSVINRPTSFNLNDSKSYFAISSSNTVYSVPSGRTPVILIPGILGSKIAKREGNYLRNLWLGGWLAEERNRNHLELGNPNNAEDPNNYRDISVRPVVATEILRNIDVGGAVTIPRSDVYDRLINYLIGLGYRQYDVTSPNQRTINGCDTTQIGADLFIFPYDWRNSNWTSARDLYEYVQCIKNIRGNPNQKIHIVAHSMGGLVARRYILNNPNNHSVERMVTLGTPWLGAPKSIGIMETGDYAWTLNQVISKNTLKAIAPQIKGAHELIPSRAYTDVLTTNIRGDFPLGEEGWDFNFDNRQTGRFNFSQLKLAMNVNYNNRPGDRTDNFHNQVGQDYWTANNLYGVDYYNFVGYGHDTVGTLMAKRNWRGENSFEPTYTDGDGTVPLVSARRIGTRNLINYRGPIKLEKGFLLSHKDLASEDSHQNGSTFRFINCVVNIPNAESCIAAQPAASRVGDSQNFVGEPYYSLKTIGVESIIVIDSFGNTANPLSTSVDEGVSTVEFDVIGDKYLTTSFPLDQTYRAIVKSPATPFSIILTKNDGETITQAIRYVDITLPANVLALLEITPQGATVLKYDSDGNGTFDTSVNTTINVTGTQAQDTESPVVVVNETVQDGTSQIVLEATDAGTGVRQIMYSLNGTTFHQYSTPLTLNSAQTPTIYVLADDNVFNRSGLVTHNLTTLNVGFNVAGPSVATPGSQIKVNWNAPSGRPVDDWVGLFRVGTLNSTYISKQYTDGQSTGSLSFTLPNQPGLYECRYLINDGLSSVATSNEINANSNRRAGFDFDGDGKADVSVFRPNTGAWYLQQSTSGFTGVSFGISTDKLVPADYDGDGKTDIAVFRNGTWYLQRSQLGFTGVTFGDTADIPMPADYDGDGKADIVVFRPSSGTWYLLQSTAGFTGIAFGQNGDKPVAADYDGDGKTDVAVYRSGTWYLQRSQLGFTGVSFGESTDKPVVSDYDGDGKTDMAVFRPSNGVWYLLQSTVGFTGIAFGLGTDLPIPADYDGDGKADIAVFRNGTWYLQKSTAGFTGIAFGVDTDLPVPNIYVP